MNDRMKKKGFFILLIVGILIASAGCVKEKDNKSDIDIGEPSDYFPTDIGREWTYKIQIGEVQPIQYRETIWPFGKASITYSYTGIFRNIFTNKIPKNPVLQIKIKKQVSQLGKSDRPIGLKLTVVKDDAGIFEYSDEVFWVITNSGRFIVKQIVTYSPLEDPGAPSILGSDGFSNRILFFEGEPGVGAGIENSPDILFFHGIDTNVPGYKGTPCLYFQRVVKIGDEKSKSVNSLSRDFTEDTWFCKKIGLVRFEQKVEGKNSMTWILE